MEQVFLKLVNLSFSASWLILAVLVLRLLFRRAPKWIFCVLWGLAALRLVCPVSIESVLSLIPSAEVISPGIMLDATPEIQTGIGFLNGSINPIIAELYTPDPATSANPLQILIPIWSLLWLIGVAGMLIYALVSCLLLRHRVAAATRLRDNIKQSEHVDSPFVLGIIRPTIYLPYRIDTSDMEYVIAHEQAHIRRRDHLWKPLGFLLLSVYWFNPLLWIAYVLLCRDIEAACDEKVIRMMETDDRRAYSTALLNCSVHRRRIAACPLAFGEVGVKSRIKNVMHYKKPAFWVVIAAIVVCIVTAVCFLTNPPKAPDDTFVTNPLKTPDDTLEPSSGILNGSKQLTLDDVLRLSEKGEALTWEDFAGFTHKDVGSGLFIASYEIDETFYLLIGDGKMTGKPMYIRLRVRDSEDYADVFTEDVAAFVEEHRAMPIAIPTVAINPSVNVPQAVLDTASALVAEHIKTYNEYGASQSVITGTTYTITEAWVDSITRFDTGTAGITDACYLYKMECRLKPSETQAKNIFLASGMRLEDGWFVITEPYFAMYCDWSSGTEVWTFLGTISEQTISAEYATDAMLATYGNQYTAAVMEMRKAYLSGQEESLLLFGQPLAEFIDAAWEEARTAGENADIQLDKESVTVRHDSESSVEFRFTEKGNSHVFATVILKRQADGTYAVDPTLTSVVCGVPLQKTEGE